MPWELQVQLWSLSPAYGANDTNIYLGFFLFSLGIFGTDRAQAMAIFLDVKSFKGLVRRLFKRSLVYPSEIFITFMLVLAGWRAVFEANGHQQRGSRLAITTAVTFASGFASPILAGVGKKLTFHNQPHQFV